MTDNNHPFTDAEIVAGLRSDELKERTAAMAALFPGSGHDALLIEASAASAQTATTPTIDARRMFHLLIQVTQHFGSLVGMRLDWVPDQAQQDQIVVPQGLMR